ncbi:MAG: ArnT family glycosyltransferase, partial [Roseimicrobium sp.]
MPAFTIPDSVRPLFHRLPDAKRLLLALFVARLAFLPFFCHVTDLAGDESYYWAWGQRPDWCYFSKPPLIGWLMGLVGLATGNAEWGIRLAALLFGTASLWFLQALARAMFDASAARIALLLAALCPANVALNLFFTIDAPLVLCWSAALLALWRVIEQPAMTWRWTLLALAMCVGVLAKQMMLVFPLLMVLLFALTSELRPLLRRTGLWLSIAAALLCLAPVVWWNQQHQWITLQHTSHHFDARQMSGLMEWLGRFLSFPGMQSALFTPLTWLLMIAAAFGGLFNWASLDKRARLLVLFSAPGLVIFFLLALRQSINPNWPAAFYLSAVVLLAGQLTSALPISLWMARMAKPALALAATMTVLTYSLPLLIKGSGLEWHARLDPLDRVRGWSEIGAQAGKLLEQTPRPRETFVLAVGHREHASQLAFYM